MGYNPAPQGMSTRYKSRLNYPVGAFKCKKCGALIVSEPCRWCSKAEEGTGQNDGEQ